MSLINDALKRAQQSPPRQSQTHLPPLPPAEESTPIGSWLAPAFVIFLIVAAIFFIGWAVARHSVHSIVVAPPDPAVVSQQAAEMAVPVIAPPPPPLPVNPPDAPRLQGIFYSPAAPTAIVDGKTVSVGSHYLHYRVTEITKSTVTLVEPDGKAIKLSMAD